MDGKQLAENILADLKDRIIRLRQVGIEPALVALQFGDHKPSEIFLKKKAQKAESIGLRFHKINLPATISAEEAVSLVRLECSRPIHGLTIQLPLPENLIVATDDILNAIDPAKDVDVLTQENKQAFEQGRPRFVPPTTAAIFKLLEAYSINLADQSILVIGQGALVGKPVSTMLRLRGLDITVADKETSNISQLLAQATLIITATGQPGLIKPEHVNPQAIIIDAGTAESDGKLTGDVLPEVASKASFLTPVPGGVGPVTVAQLLANVVEAAERAAN